jgi:hypothetical protein
MAAAVRRAVQQHGAQQLQALHWPSAAIRGGVLPLDAISSDFKYRLPLPMGTPSTDWMNLHERRSHTLWNHGTERGFHNRQISQLVSAASSKRAFLVDTLALVLSLPTSLDLLFHFASAESQFL